MKLSDPIFTDADKARAYMESERWADGAYCSHCGSFSVTHLTGKAHRPGLHQCNDCREQFTITTGTVFERSKVPLNKWLLATYLLSAGKKGTSAHQIHRVLGVTYKTAWFMCHRIREAMRNDAPSAIGGSGKIVEADETYFGDKDRITKRTRRGKSGLASKRAVVSLVERGGEIRTFHVDRATKESVREVIVRNVSRKSTLHTDESRLYVELGGEFASHQAVRHSAGEYVRGEVHTNTVEGYFSIFKRGMKGVYQHCGEAHLFRYLAEFDFRYNNRSGLGVEDTERTAKVIQQAGGKRLTYRRTNEAEVA
jgi:transposase-like protein